MGRAAGTRWSDTSAVASRDREVAVRRPGSRLARQNQRFFRKPKANRSGVRRFTGFPGVCSLKLSLCNAKQRYGVDVSNLAMSTVFYSGQQWAQEPIRRTAESTKNGATISNHAPVHHRFRLKTCRNDGAVIDRQKNSIFVQRHFFINDPPVTCPPKDQVLPCFSAQDIVRRDLCLPNRLVRDFSRLFGALAAAVAVFASTPGSVRSSIRYSCVSHHRGLESASG